MKTYIFKTKSLVKKFIKLFITFIFFSNNMRNFNININFIFNKNIFDIKNNNINLGAKFNKKF